MRKEILSKYLDLEKIKHISIGRFEELIIVPDDTYDSLYLVQLKLQNNRLITIGACELNSYGYNKTLDNYHMRLINGRAQSSKRSNIVLIQTPVGIKMYDTFYKRFCYDEITFTKMFTRSEDFYPQNEEDNLIRTEKNLRGFFNNEFVLEVTLTNKEKIYVMFTSSGRIIRIYDDPLDSISLIAGSEPNFMPNGKYEDSLIGDELSLTDLVNTIQRSFKEPIANRTTQLLCLRKKD